MTRRNPCRLSVAAVLVALVHLPLLADEDPVERVLVFGDSLSDGGYYTTLIDEIPPGAGSFTTNPDPVAPEVVGGILGFLLQPAYGADGTNYATGGARVTATNDLSIPITTQVDNFLAAGNTFSSRDLVYIQGGGNDFFAFLADGADDEAILTDAATQLAAQVERIQSLGVSRIVTMSVQSAGSADLQLFNQTYEAEIAARGLNVLYFDTDALFTEILAGPAEFGITNTVDTACNVSSLVCTPFSFVEPGANESYLLADAVHPAGIAQFVQGQAVASMVQAPEQIGQLSYALQAAMDGHTSLARQARLAGAGNEGGSTTIFGDVGLHDSGNDGSRQRLSLREENSITALGVHHQFTDAIGAGATISYSTGDGRFGGDAGGYDTSALAGTAHVTYRAGKLTLSGDVSLGQVDYDDLTRKVNLGPTARFHESDTEGDYTAVRMGGAYEIYDDGFVKLSLRASISHENIDIDGYAEGSTLSTAASFGGQELTSTLGRIGATARFGEDTGLGYYLRASFTDELDDDRRSITIVPNGAPVPYTSDIFTADEAYVSYDFGISYRLERLTVIFGASGYAQRAGMDSVNVLLGAKIVL